MSGISTADSAGGDAHRLAAEIVACRLGRITDWLPANERDDTLTLAGHTTFRVGGPARRLVRAGSEAEIIAAVQAADEAGEPLLVLSGGSNVLVSDAGFAGTVVLVDNHGLSAEISECGGVLVRVAAGETWDDFVAYTIEQGWAGVEALSGVPGLVGATPIQNVGAYGQEVAQTIARVRAWDRQRAELRTFVTDQCGFGYRDSVFKRSRRPDQPTGRHVVLEVVFQFRLAGLSEPIGYRQLADTLGVSTGQRVPAAEVRAAVLELRRSKGMVADVADRDSWSAGSFFTNPILPAAQAEALPPEAPRFPAGGDLVKTSAAWLIDHAGFGKGFPGRGPARLSSKHVLALTNHADATAAQLIDLAREVRNGVHARFGVWLEAEPVLVGLTLCGDPE